MSNGFFVNSEGYYERECSIVDGLAQGLIQVPVAPFSAKQVWDFETESWGRVPQIVPDKVTMRQARLALLGAGLLDDVEAALEAFPGVDGQAARIEWNYSSEVHRNKPFVLILGAQLNLDDEQLDQLFITAAGIE